MLHCRPVCSVANCTLSVQGGWGLIPGPVKSAQFRQRLAPAVMFLRSYVCPGTSRAANSKELGHFAELKLELEKIFF